MSDPAVCGFLTKTLCAHGGRLELPELRERSGLSAQQLEETLSAAGPRRFLVLRDGGGGGRVLAVSDVRICVRRECDGCERLHLCKQNLMGRCHLGTRSCKYSHNIISDENRKVLKTHELSSLDENELRVLLLHNDPFLLPDVCHFYNRKDGTCNQQNNCNKLHVCRHFVQGECRFLPCKRSHDLLDSHAFRVLQMAGIDWDTASKIQTIYEHRHTEFNKEVKKWKISNYKANQNVKAKPAVSKGEEQKKPVVSVMHMPPSGGPYNNVPGHITAYLPTGAGSKDKGTGAGGKDKVDGSSAKTSKGNKEDKQDEICVFHVWKYCKHRDKCRSVHYHLPYRWQVYNGLDWNDLPMMEEIEKHYCDPCNSRIIEKSIDFQTMTCCSSLIRRLSTPSSVTKPSFVLTTVWVWYWMSDLGQWVEYGKQGEEGDVSSPSSAIIENLYLADPDATINFQAGRHYYELNFKEMVQTNISYKTRRRVRRRPKFVSSEDVQKIKKGSQRDSSIPNQACPAHWDPSALPEFGYKAVEISNTTSEYHRIKLLFEQTMNNYKILKLQRIQNPSLWKVFQWQKEQMKRENGGKEVFEKLLFHGTKTSFVESICVHNFDWRICGSNGTNYGKGSYFARDASYSHAYCQPVVKTRTMFVARVLVGDYIRGNTTYVRPPAKSADGLRFYDSCVDNVLDPSIFVVFEKYQIYPEYLIEYKEDEKCTLS